MRRALIVGLVCVLSLAACLEDMDDPSKVVDLRVLGMQTSPPEKMLKSCELLTSGGDLSSVVPADGGMPDIEVLQQLLDFVGEVELRTLVEDPGGNGRSLRYELFACSSQGDRRCEEERVKLAEGESPAGELSLSVTPLVEWKSDGGISLPELRTVSDGGSLIVDTLMRDTYKGFGGVRLPLVLHVSAGDEEVWAQKLMVYSCQRFPEMEANENPELPGLLLEGTEWGAEEVRELSGPGPFSVESMDYRALEKEYWVPTLELPPKAQRLEESWQISWHTDYGRLEPTQTIGTLPDGNAGEPATKWIPPEKGAEARERVRIWAVVRDGRGGQSWLGRTFRYTP